jgi:thiol:disulfide interchange protein
MKRYLLFTIIIIALAISACKQKEYHEMKVYPAPREITAAQGDDCFMVLQVEIPGKSHIYGNPKGPGTGKPTEVSVKAPVGIMFGIPRFLSPEKFYFLGDKHYTWGYSGETRIFIPFTVRETAAPGPVNVAVTLDSLMCTEVAGGYGSCVPKLFRFDVTIEVVKKGSTACTHDRSVVSEYAESKAPTADGKTVLAKKEVGTEDRSAAILDNLKFSPRYIEKGITGLVQAILFGLIAGIILNFMPCVLPVVSLKVMNFVQHANESRKKLLILGLFFSSGILASFALLASLAAFFGYAWGGLFQHRLFLVVMTGIVFAFALSLFGVFSINTPFFVSRSVKDHGNPYIDAFVKGLLATLLATPCSGPFLGGTLAWTLSQPPAAIIAVFMSIGTGMALPYIILTALPKLLRYIPKPGEWLYVFEQVMGFLLVFTVIYLVGVFSQDSVLPMVAFLGFIAIGLWQYGRYGSLHRTPLTRAISSVVLAVIIVSGYFISFHYFYTKSEMPGITGQSFSAERMVRNRDTGRISVIDFTAEWCPNCTLVESLTLKDEKVVSAFREGDIDFMIADITTKNPSAEYLMSRFRSQSIPLLAVIPPGQSFGEPVVLRDIYSVDDVLTALKMARVSNTKREQVEYQIDMPDSLLKK